MNTKAAIESYTENVKCQVLYTISLLYKGYEVTRSNIRSRDFTRLGLNPRKDYG